MKYQNIREEELKNRLAQDYFWIYDCAKIVGNVDFCVCMQQSTKELFEQESLLWAEAKRGSSDIYKSLVQLILTIGKARTFDKFLPPSFLGAFDGEKIAFVPYNEIHDVFYQNDFNWNVTPSDHQTKEFQLVYEKVKTAIEQKAMLFFYEKDDRELKRFIKINFIVGKCGLTKTKIDKNNFMVVYNKWLQTVKPTIAANWDMAQKNGIIDGDFYLADLLSQENNTLKDKLFVLLKRDHYEFDRKIHESGFFNFSTTDFLDKQVAHTQFWNRYDRPPKEEYWDYIVERRDLLVPQDVRERKGSFFTPQIWVELSQKYLADVLGEDWQDEYYIWDCAAGTGNLLNGLTNKYNIWASTLDQQDVEVMHDRIRNGANLLESHVFQFDFLNDDFSKLPQGLQDIINDEEKRRKLVIYINPPYAEAGGGMGKTKEKVSTENKTYEKYKNRIGKASNELYAQFFIRIYCEINGAVLAEFSKLKILQAPNFSDFRKIFHAKLEKLFVVPADTFDNVKGKFPIGFFIWNTAVKEIVESCNASIFDAKNNFIWEKIFYAYDNTSKYINDWLRQYFDKRGEPIGFLHNNKNDFQHNTQVCITTIDNKDHTTPITQNNIVQMCIYLAIRHCIEATWLNDRDQFLYPNDGWKTDKEFQSDCLAFTLFHGQNRICRDAVCHVSTNSVNHWIPFTEEEVDAKEKFASHFMTDFIQGKIKQENAADLFENQEEERKPLEFSAEATAVFNAGRELWKYYHAQPDLPCPSKGGDGTGQSPSFGGVRGGQNASLYDIREYFQGRNENGKMNNKSEDEKYNLLIGNLRQALKELAKKIEPKVYEYGFLK